MVSRGEVWLIRLDPAEGGELQKTRPCLVVSPSDLNPFRVFTVVPLTSGGFPAPFRPPVTYQGREGFVLTDQIRTVARSRMIRRLPDLDPQILTATLAALREMFEE
ncbi:MAG: transcriptional modulator of MazE/toxin, MazF [Caulobacter sp.]|nr:transcriptional modulator of MazE/toxin, MazF [Caulobacter sp.]